MKIAIVVPGRFHALELAAALIARGHEVTVFTNYPPWAVRKFGLDPEHVRSIWPLGIVERAIARIIPERLLSRIWPFFQRTLGRWAARQLSREHFDVIHEFSGVGEEVIRACSGDTKHLLMRASSHIRTQAEILRQEAERTGIALAEPSDWIIAREEREYAAADYVVVPARFCRDSFVRQGVPEEKLLLLPFGVDTRKFTLSEEMIERRCRRILSGAPLTVLTTGQVSFRKGLYDYAKIAARLDGRFRFRWIGFVREEAKNFITRLPGSVELVPHLPQNSLPGVYAEGDLFLLPTVEDGFPYVLMQAYA
ncbi:MAG: glycosyltransferase family 4 protein, partial [Acidobacteriia bacterium]|nr:glycosyltransferase family 4 protein [Terriglobia bacterium]